MIFHLALNFFPDELWILYGYIIFFSGFFIEALSEKNFNNIWYEEGKIYFLEKNKLHFLHLIDKKYEISKILAECKKVKDLR